jgi:TonB family protein
MFRPFLQVFLTLVSLALTSTTAAQQSPVLETTHDVDAFCQTYYLRPRPELIADVIDALHSTGFLQRATAVPPYVAFFSEVFAANPDRLPQWQVLIAKQDEQTKAALERALSLSKAGGVLKLEGHSAELNDMYWGAYFASGNVDYLKKLMEQLRYFDERDDFYLFLAGGTAKWSLASNAQSDILVRHQLEAAKHNVDTDKRTQELISELLSEDPSSVKEEINEILRKQREAGKWSYAPANTGSGRIHNIAPEEMWKRVTQCVLPKYPGLASDSHITGTVDIGLGISPEGAVDNARVLDGPPFLAESAVDAIRQWKFRPNVAQGEVTWSRVRALVRFNADGTTAVDLAPAILADNFGDPGTPRAVAASFPRPGSSPECKPVQPWTGAEVKEIESSEVGPELSLPPDVAAVMQGLRLTQDEVSAAEKTLVGSPDDLNAHLKLIGYYSDRGEKRTDWLKYVLWLVDHHPESAALGIPLPPVQLVFTNRQWLPPLEVIHEYLDHWEHAVAAHARDTVVLSHAALALGNISEIDPNFSLPPARKLTELDPACKDCRRLVGFLYGRAILRIGGSYVPCLPKTADAEQIVATLRKEIESQTDPEILVSAGMTMRSFSGYYSQRCGGNADEAVQLGMKLVRKAVALDPSLIDRDKLQDVLNSRRQQ